MGDKNRERIVETAVRLFNYRGYKQVTMREIAKDLGMSCKTIYNYFSSKEEIAEVVLRLLDENADIITNIMNSKADPITKLKEYFGLTRTILTRINPLLLRDIGLYAPELWKKRERKREEVLTFMEGLIREGQDMGIIKKSIDPKMAIDMYSGIFRAAANPDTLGNKGYSTDEVLDFLIEVFFSGICER